MDILNFLYRQLANTARAVNTLTTDNKITTKHIVENSSKKNSSKRWRKLLYFVSNMEII